MENTQFHRKALALISVSYFHIHTKIDEVKVFKESPFYDVYIYHGCIQNC